MAKRVSKFLLFVMSVALMAVLGACSFTGNSNNPFENQVNDSAMGKYTAEDAVDISTNAINNLKKHLESDVVSETGYFVQFDMDFDSDNGSHFTLRFKANLFTFPHVVLDKDGNPVLDENGKPLIDPEKEKIHNEVIKKNDLIIEWFDGHTNNLLMGMYFDGKNSSLTNPGNNLYLNLRGESRRMFKDFGDSVMYRQIVRLITSLNIDKMIGGDGVEGTVKTLRDYLLLAVTNNYKVTKNNDVTSTFYSQINFDPINKDITKMLHDTFGPFGDKIDPLTNHYLGFKLSTLGGADIRSMTADLRFLSENQSLGGGDVLCGAEINASGTALVKNKIVAFDTDVSFSYSSRVQSNIKVTEYIDITEYNEFLYGNYEYQGELYIPMMEKQGMESRMDAVVRTKLTSDVDKNDENRIQMSFTDKANGSRLLLGAYYCNERTYLNTTGLQNLYGGIKINEIGFPKAFMDGPNIAQLLTDFGNTINSIITDYVDGVISGVGSSVLFDEIMKKMTSGEETISIRIDLELIKIVLRETQEGNPEYSTQDIIDMLSDAMGYDMEEIAFMLGITDAKRMLEKTWFDLTYNVVTNAIRIEMSSNAMNENVKSLVFRLDLFPIKIGEAVTFPDGFDTWFDDYKQLQEVKTISANINGTVSFTNSAAVDISDLLGAMVGDKSGLNTRYFLPASSSLGFSMVFDQYVKFDNYPGDIYPGDPGWEDNLGEMRGRIGFKLEVWENLASGGRKPIVNVYAKDVAFNTNCEESELGYVWVDIQATGFTKVKIREDVFLASLTDYMGGNSAAEEAMALSIPQIIGALLEDSNSLSFLPDVIQLSTSNKTIQKLFGVKAVLLSAEVDVGLTPRVTGIAQLEDEFADYTVGTLADMTGEDKYSKGVYEKNLYDTIAVTFTRGGSSWLENLRVPYYRVPEPGDPKDYDSQEEYDAAVAKHKEYLKSQHCLNVIDGKFMYYPATDGDFMGQFRSYTVEIRKTGGNSLTSVTSKILRLSSTEHIWEPLEAEPNIILGAIQNGSVQVPAKFSLDFASITIDGLPRTQYTVTVGPGSIGETTFLVFVTVRNRRIMKENGASSDLATVYTNADGAKQAPVAATVSIDPYDYILWRGDYFKNNGHPTNPIGQYLQSRSELRSVIFRFGDGVTERITLVWSFDKENSVGLNNEKYINATGGNAVFAHAYFHNQLVTLRINVLAKVFDYVRFDNETANNTYTVDVLNTASKTIPTTPTVYFKDGTSRKFPFALEWANPVANNVTLQGAAIVEGKESPFVGQVGNQNVAWLSIGKVYGESGDWFREVLITTTVEAPAKNIEDVYRVENPLITSAGSIHFAKDVMLDGGAVRGYWIIDPLKPQTWLIPAALTAYFVGEGGVRTERRYGSDVISFRDENGLLTVDGGKYRFTAREADDKTVVRTYVITCWISDEFSFDLIVAVLPAFDINNDGIVFFDKNGIEMNVSEIGKDQSNAQLYNYTLDPFKSLFLPQLFEIRSNINGRNVMLTSADGSVSEKHYARYDVKPELRQNQMMQYQYVLQGDYRFVVYLKLNPTHDRDQIEKVVLNGGLEILQAQIVNGFRFDKFNLDAQGFVLDAADHQIIVDGSAVKLADYIRYLFRSVQIVTASTTVNLTPQIIDFDKFDVQATLSGNGVTFVVAYSEILDWMNMNMIIQAEGLDTIVEGNNPSLQIQPFTADGKEIHKDGYALFSQEFSVKYAGDKGTVVFKSSNWLVSQVINLKGNLLSEGSVISVISPEVLRADRENASEDAQIILYAFLSDSSKITLSVRITPLDFAAFVSADNELFPIKIRKNDVNKNYSVVEVSNMYAKREYLVDAGTLLSFLPTTVKIGGTQIDHVTWLADASLANNLKNLAYKSGSNGGITEFKLSSAKVQIGTSSNPYIITLDLYIRFLPAVLSSVIPDGTFGDTSGIYFEQTAADGNNKVVTLKIRPYQTEVGKNVYFFPTTYKAKFNNDSTTYEFNLNMLYGGSAFNKGIVYDFNGTKNFVLSGADTKNKLTFVLDAGFKQHITVNVEFVDQTVGTVAAGTSDLWFGKMANGVYDIGQIDTTTTKVSSNFEIDPYGVKYLMKNGNLMFIPTLVRINETKSAVNYSSAANVTVQWSQYDVLFGGAALKELKGKIIREGFADQEVTIKFSVKNRSASQENIVFADETLASGEVTVTTQGGRPIAHIHNPFTFRYKNDLPKKIKSVRYTDGSVGENVPIFWQMEDTAIDYNGNNMSTKSVKYRLNDQNGQEFTFFLLMDKWEYVSLEREVGGNWQEMTPIYFLISAVSGQSDLTDFRILFRVTDATGKGVSNRSQQFYSETSKAVTVDKREPVLYFDKAAIELARANGTDVQGTFSLGGENKLRYEVQKSMATTWYSSAKPSISEAFFKYNVLTTDYYSAYVLIDPLKPVWPKSVFAYVNWTTERVELEILDQGSPFNIDLIKYLNRGGGVIIGRSAYVRYTDKETGEKIAFMHKINIAVLDRTPTSIHVVTGAEPPRALAITAKDNYNRNTYVGMANPYSDSYNAVTSYLNTAVLIYGATADITDIVWDKTTKASVSFKANGITHGSAAVPCTLLSYRVQSN